MAVDRAIPPSVEVKRESLPSVEQGSIQRRLQIDAKAMEELELGELHH